MMAARKRRRSRRIDDAMTARGGIRTTGHEGTSAAVLVVRMILIVQATAIDGNCARPAPARRGARWKAQYAMHGMFGRVRRFSAPALPCGRPQAACGMKCSAAEFMQ
jgi:hypothetical protein